MLVIDTNVLIDAANDQSESHHGCRDWLNHARVSDELCLLTWPIIFEFMRVTTHPRIMKPPWTVRAAWRFISTILESPSISILLPTDRHAEIVEEVTSELPSLAGNILHDAHTAILMREHAINRICTRDADFRHFRFIAAFDPLKG